MVKDNKEWQPSDSRGLELTNNRRDTWSKSTLRDQTSRMYHHTVVSRACIAGLMMGMMKRELIQFKTGENSLDYI